MTLKSKSFGTITPALLTVLAGCAHSTPSMNANSVKTADAQACQITAPFSITQFGEDFTGKVDALMAHMMDRGLAPGAVVRINQKGETVFSKAYGYADLEDKKPMKTDSLFRIYSMTKPITSVAALKLVDEGKLDLDAPISRYLPEFADVKVMEGTGTRAPSRAPTIRDLMRHTTGFTYFSKDEENPLGIMYAMRGVLGGPGFDLPESEGYPAVKGNNAFITRISDLPLKHDPGAEFSYGNSTDVLGIIVAKVSGQSLGEYFQDNIFDSLGMEDAAFQLPADRLQDFTSAYAVPKQTPPGSSVDDSLSIDELDPQKPFRTDSYTASVYSKPPAIEFGGAGLVMDADDYLAFTAAMMDKEQRLISPDLWASATRDQLPESARAASDTLGERGFGLGFAVRLGETQGRSVFPQCGLFWAGAASTYFWIDEETETSGVLMAQVFGGDVGSYFSALLADVYPSSND